MYPSYCLDTSNQWLAQKMHATEYVPEFQPVDDNASAAAWGEMWLMLIVQVASQAVQGSLVQFSISAQAYGDGSESYFGHDSPHVALSGTVSGGLSMPS